MIHQQRAVLLCVLPAIVVILALLTGLSLLLLPCLIPLIQCFTEILQQEQANDANHGVYNPLDKRSYRSVDPMDEATTKTRITSLIFSFSFLVVVSSTIVFFFQLLLIGIDLTV